MSTTTLTCNHPTVRTSCESPYCEGQHCPTCNTGCDLDTPDGICEGILRVSPDWSDRQAAEIRARMTPAESLSLVLSLSPSAARALSLRMLMRTAEVQAA